MNTVPPNNHSANRRKSAGDSGITDCCFGGNGPRHGAPVVRNRIRAVLKHTRRYAFRPQSRLAADMGVARSTISRLLRNKVRPGLPLVLAITAALEKDLERRLDPRELVRFDTEPWPTASVCELVGCSGCLPDEAYDAAGRRRPEWKDVPPGHWSDLPDPPAAADPPRSPAA